MAFRTEPYKGNALPLRGPQIQSHQLLGKHVNAAINGPTRESTGLPSSEVRALQMLSQANGKKGSKPIIDVPGPFRIQPVLSGGHVSLITQVVDNLVDVKRQGNLVLPDANSIGRVEQIAVDVGASSTGGLAIADRIGAKAEKSLQPVEVSLRPKICDIIRAAIIISNWHRS